MQISKLSPVSFNGQYRNVKVRRVASHEYHARVLDSQKDSGRCLFAEEAVYRAIKNSNDYKNDAEILKCSNIKMNRKQRETIASVYYTDENEKVDANQIKSHANFIVLAQGSSLQN